MLVTADRDQLLGVHQIKGCVLERGLVRQDDNTLESTLRDAHKIAVQKTFKQLVVSMCFVGCALLGCALFGCALLGCFVRLCFVRLCFVRLCLLDWHNRGSALYHTVAHRRNHTVTHRRNHKNTQEKPHSNSQEKPQKHT